MPQLSLSLTVNGKTETCDCPDAACLAACLEDFYATLAGLARDPAAHKAAAGGKGKTLTISGYAAADGVPYSPLLLVVAGLSDADLRHAEKELADCCQHARARAGQP